MQFTKIYMVKEGKGPKVRESHDLVRVLKEYYRNHDREEFLVVCLDSKHHISAINSVSVGSLNLNIVHPREVFKSAILANSAAIIIAHNHPSGDPTPSPEDREITQRLKTAGGYLGIAILDHIVVGDDTHVSFADQGTL